MTAFNKFLENLQNLERIREKFDESPVTRSPIRQKFHARRLRGTRKTENSSSCPSPRTSETRNPDMPRPLGGKISAYRSPRGGRKPKFRCLPDPRDAKTKNVRHAPPCETTQSQKSGASPTPRDAKAKNLRHVPLCETTQGQKCRCLPHPAGHQRQKSEACSNVWDGAS